MKWILVLTVALLSYGCETDDCGDYKCVDPNSLDQTTDDIDGDGLLDDEEIALGTDPTLADTDGDGRLDSTEVELGTNPIVADDVCVTDRYSADFRTRPVDIIFVIDNSGSMRDEIESVERNINQNFAEIMDQAGLDYRVIMISKHGTYNGLDSDICVSSPLSGTSCDPVPDAPVNSERFFHFDTEIGSDNSFQKVLSTYSGWSDWLRTDAFKVFIEITDDASDGPSAAEFEASLFGLEPAHFGNPGSRNYIWHSIVGLYPREDDPALPYSPDMALTPFQCGTSESAGEEYQKLSIVTGGLRYPVCLFDNYDAVFRAAAVKTIEDADIDCSLNMPIAPSGFRINSARMALEFTNRSKTRLIEQVDGPNACRTDAFWVSGSTIEICPELCPEVEQTQTGSLAVISMCEPQTCETPSQEVCDDMVDNDCDGFADRLDIECFL